MAQNRFFTPSNARIYGVAQVPAIGTSATLIEYKLLDDIAQITFSTPADAKPVLQLGQKEQLGYTYGQRLYAGTMQVPANAFPSIFNLFTTWFDVIREQYKGETDDKQSTLPYITANAEDLPFFDIVIISLPENLSKDDPVVNTFVYVIKDVKIIETSADLNAVSPQGQLMLYRFVQNYIGQKLLVVPQENGKLNIDLSLLLDITKIEDPKYGTKFTDLVIRKLYKGG